MASVLSVSSNRISGVLQKDDVAINSEPWLFESSSKLDLVRRLETEFPSIQDVGCKVGIGVATGADRLYGKRAYDQTLLSPNNVAAGFKRLMGTSSTISLEAANLNLSPEECSIEIIKILMGQAYTESGEEDVQGVVITIPAAFNQMQSEATIRAATEAGVVLMPYSRGCHTAFHHRYHIVWAPKYRFKVLHGEVRLRVREIIRQVCSELGVTIIHGALSRDHVHMFVEIPPHIAVSDFVRRAKGRSSRKIQQEFEHIRKRYWGQRFWQRGYFSTTSGNITDNVILNYLDKHTKPNKAGFSPKP